MRGEASCGDDRRFAVSVSSVLVLVLPSDICGVSCADPPVISLGDRDGECPRIRYGVIRGIVQGVVLQGRGVVHGVFPGITDAFRIVTVQGVGEFSPRNLSVQSTGRGSDGVSRVRDVNYIAGVVAIIWCDHQHHPLGVDNEVATLIHNYRVVVVVRIFVQVVESRDDCVLVGICIHRCDVVEGEDDSKAVTLDYVGRLRGVMPVHRSVTVLVRCGDWAACVLNRLVVDDDVDSTLIHEQVAADRCDIIIVVPACDVLVRVLNHGYQNVDQIVSGEVRCSGLGIGDHVLSAGPVHGRDVFANHVIPSVGCISTLRRGPVGHSIVDIICIVVRIVVDADRHLHLLHMIRIGPIVRFR